MNNTNTEELKEIRESLSRIEKFFTRLKELFEAINSIFISIGLRLDKSLETRTIVVRIAWILLGLVIAFLVFLVFFVILYRRVGQLVRTKGL